MKILEEKTFLHLSEQDCIQIQNQLSSKVIQKNKIPLEKIQIVAGVDTAYWMENKKEMAVCCIVVIDVKQKVNLPFYIFHIFRDFHKNNL